MQHIKTCYLVGLMLITQPFNTAVSNPLFESKEPLTAVLSAPLSQIYKNKKQDVRFYFDGSLSYKTETGQAEKLAVKIKSRGNFRRKACSLPPLRLNFNQKQNKATLMKGQNKLKLVGRCRPSNEYNQLVGLEYLVYQVFETISETHFKTRLIELNYVDTDKKKKPWKHTTFVIEDVKDAAKRSGLRYYDVEKNNVENSDLNQLALVELFQFFIGNTDYSALTGPPGHRCCHNVLLFGPKKAKLTKNNTDKKVNQYKNNNDNSKLIPVPYDFDASGFVNAPYAIAPLNYPIKTVRSRWFTGLCKDEKYFYNAINTFNQHQQTILDLINDASVISDHTRSKTVRYVEEFYSIINTPKRAQRLIFGRCRK